MASLQQRSGWFHLLFRYDGRQYSHALKTRDRREADAIRGTVDRVLIRVRNQELPPPPPDADVTAYLLAGGKVVDETRSATPMLTLRELSDRYIQTHGHGALEPKTLVMLRIHFTHLIRHFGERKVVAQLTTGLLQEYVTARCQEKGKRRRLSSPVTVQKDLANERPQDTEVGIESGRLKLFTTTIVVSAGQLGYRQRGQRFRNGCCW